MTRGFESFLALPDQDRRDILEAAAARLDTLPSYVEKDFWVCLVLDTSVQSASRGASEAAFQGWNVAVQSLRTH